MFTETYLTRIISEFSKLHPDISFEINTSYQRYNLTESHYDMAFRATSQPPPDNMIAKKLFNYQHQLVASPDYLNSSVTLKTPNDISRHVCLTAEQTKDWTWGDQTIPLKRKVACNSNLALKQLAVSGAGIAKLPSFYMKGEIGNGSLIP